jgi:transposase
MANKRWRYPDAYFQPGASFAQIAQVNGVNANQGFKWRRAFERSELPELSSGRTALLAVTVSAPLAAVRREGSAQQHPTTSGSIHIEFSVHGS